MANAPATGRRQRASRLSRDLLMELSAAWVAVRIARTLARKLEAAAPGPVAGRLAREIEAHITAARKALGRAARPPRRASHR